MFLEICGDTFDYHYDWERRGIQFPSSSHSRGNYSFVGQWVCLQANSQGTLSSLRGQDRNGAEILRLGQPHQASGELTNTEGRG